MASTRGPFVQTAGAAALTAALASPADGSEEDALGIDFTALTIGTLVAGL
jgi:hypothetical protein